MGYPLSSPTQSELTEEQQYYLLTHVWPLWMKAHGLQAAGEGETQPSPLGKGGAKAQAATNDIKQRIRERRRAARSGE